MSDAADFDIDDEVEKLGGDYRFRGRVVSIFRKLSGQWRLVVENDDGLLFIFNPTQLRKCSTPEAAR